MDSLRKYKKICLLLGSNLGDSKDYIDFGRNELSKRAGIITACSGIYESDAWGFESTDKFLNQAILMESSLDPFEFLEQITIIEKSAGRERTGKGYSSRTLDIDILFYDNIVVDEPGLTIPHPLLHKRRFGLLPLCEIAPELIHPLFNMTVRDLLNQCSDMSEVKPLILT